MFAHLRMFVECLMAPGTRGEGGGERHDGHERKKDGHTLNTSWITDKRSQSFFVSWKLAYERFFSKGGTFSLASARRTNWSTPCLLSERKSQGEVVVTHLPQLQKPMNISDGSNGTRWGWWMRTRDNARQWK